MSKKTTLNCLSAILFIFLYSTSFATSTKWERNTLKGLKKLFVVVQTLRQGDVEIGIPEEKIKEEIEFELTSRGFEVLDSTKAKRIGNVLGVTVSILRSDTLIDKSLDVYIYTVDLVIRQKIILRRNRFIHSSAITWYAAETGICKLRNLDLELSQSLKRMMDKFFIDYYKVN
ncbi:MAG: hypothetical protein ACE5D6_03655 [Candidatus Zixiibacteriota bacterium]